MLCTMAGNVTMNNSIVSTGEDGGKNLLEDCKPILTVQKVLLGSELVISIILNGTVILMILKKGLRNTMTFFVLNLALTDFSMAVFYVFPLFVSRLVGQWYGGLALCRVHSFLNQLAFYASTYMLVVMSGDRLLAIARPLSVFRRSVGYRRIMIATVWLFASSIAIKDVIYSEIQIFRNKEHCQNVYPPSMVRLFVTFEAVMNVFLPALLIAVCYGWILVIVSRRVKYAPALDCTKNGSPDPVPHTTSSIIIRAKIRSTKVMFAIVSVFLVSWSPYTLNLVLLVYDLVEPSCTFFILLPLAALNSIANPILFLLFNYKAVFGQRTPNETKTTNFTPTVTVTRNSTDTPKNITNSIRLRNL